MGASLIVRLCLGLALAATAARADDTPWTSSDYVDLYFRHYNGHVPLPHLREEGQKALFKHLVDPATISRIAAAPVSNDEKLRQLRIILAVLGAYRGAYNVAMIVGEPLEQELSLVQVTALKLQMPLRASCKNPPPILALQPPGRRWWKVSLNRQATAHAIRPPKAPSWRMRSPCTIPPFQWFSQKMNAAAYASKF